MIMNMVIITPYKLCFHILESQIKCQTTRKKYKLCLGFLRSTQFEYTATKFVLPTFYPNPKLADSKEKK